jgi:hypothetical protein
MMTKNKLDCLDWDADEPMMLTDSVTGQCFGTLMPMASQATLEASPGIQGWSHPRGKVSTSLYDGGATILSFSDHCKKHLIPTYPHTKR